MTLRDKIAEAVLAYRTGNNGLTAIETADAILDVLREGVKLEWEDVEPDELFGITSRADCVFPGEYSTYVIYDDDAGGEGGVVGESGSLTSTSVSCARCCLRALARSRRCVTWATA